MFYLRNLDDGLCLLIQLWWYIQINTEITDINDSNNLVKQNKSNLTHVARRTAESFQNVLIYRDWLVLTIQVTISSFFHSMPTLAVTKNKNEKAFTA